MRCGVIARKLGMSRIFNDDGEHVHQCERDQLRQRQLLRRQIRRGVARRGSIPR